MANPSLISVEQTPEVHVIIIGDEILSGRREDKHFSFVQSLLAERHLTASRVTYIGDDANQLIAFFKNSFFKNSFSSHAPEQTRITFSFGGIGATPDDKTRQAVAAALNLPLVRNALAVAEIEQQFGAGAYPIRVRMADLPEGSQLIPNPINRVAGFSIQHHHFMPGFPQMAWPMMRWVLDQQYPELRGKPQVAKAIIIEQESESLWVAWMEWFEHNFPQLKLYSLPHLGENGSRLIELGCVGSPEDVAQGIHAMTTEADHRHSIWNYKN